MCGCFAQAQTREEYLAYLADEADRDISAEEVYARSMCIADVIKRDTDTGVVCCW